MATDIGDAAARRGAAALAARAGDEDAVRRFLADEDPKVRIAGLTGLTYLGRATRSDLDALARDVDPGVRRDACELAARMPGADVVDLLDDVEARVVEAAAFAVGELGDTSAVERLVVIARRHQDPLCRESAVAALGALGDERGKGAILDALSDSPAIRRRAVAALAAFVGDDVEAALRDRLADRDWQVRQAAQDVLDLSDEEPR